VCGVFILRRRRMFLVLLLGLLFKVVRCREGGSLDRSFICNNAERDFN
jgi:hypothetical protein